MRDALTRGGTWPAFQVAHAVATGEWTTWRRYREGMQFRRQSARWSPDQRNEWVLAAVRRAARHAFDTTRLYRRLWGEVGFDPRRDFGYDDLARLPVVRRADLQEAGDEAQSTAVPAHARRRDATGGSTGEPLTLWTGPEERGWRASGTETFFRRLGVPTGVRTAFLWGHHLDPQARDSLATRIVDAAANRERFEALRLSPDVLLSYHRRLQATRPACVVAYASTLADLAAVVSDAGGEPPAYPGRCFVTGAEKLHGPQRELIERVFGKPVHERYGSRDVGNMAFQYDPTSSDLDVDWALVHVEPAVQAPVAPILVTKLHADAMPLIRYAVEDVAEFPEGSRPGAPAFQLHAVLGRSTDRVVLPGGRWVHGLEFPHLMKDFPVRDFQVVQARDLTVEVRLVPGASFTPALRATLQRALQANLPDVPLTLREVSHIPRTAANKWRPVISEA